MRTIAVDWSGAKSRPQSKIWLAEVRDGELVRLEFGRDLRGPDARDLAQSFGLQGRAGRAGERLRERFRTCGVVGKMR